MSHKPNRFFHETTPKPRQPTVASSQHRSEFVPRNKEPNTPPAGRQIVSVPEIRRGRPTTNLAPRNFLGFSTNKVSESRASQAPQIRAQLEDKIVVINTSAFIRAFLYRNEEGRMAADEKCATRCFLTLKQKRAPRDVPKYARGRILLPPPDLFEGASYPVYINLLEYVRNSFHDTINGDDDDWPPAQEPSFHTMTPTLDNNQRLRRIYRNTHNKNRAFSRNQGEQAVLRPDLCLLVESTDKPEVSAHWKDVLVPIEVKKDKMDGDAATQSARYARAVMMEQFDRKFAFSVLLTSDECRVFYWNTVGAHVTEAINIHSDTKTFFQVMGRLATMKPADLGYDTHFSNAGRVLSFQKDIKTHLEMYPSQVDPFLDSTPAPTPTPTPNRPTTPLVLELLSTQFESKGLLFNRSTRVWRGVVVNEDATEWAKGDIYVIKQNWADDSGPNEGHFHTLAEDIPAVPELACMEVCDSTSSYHAWVTRNDVVGYLFPLNVKCPRQPPMEAYSVPRSDAPRTPDAGSGREVDNRILDEDEDCVASDVEDASDEDYVAGGVERAGSVDLMMDAEAIFKEFYPEPKAGDDSPSGNPVSNKRGYFLERVLLRFAFKREGRSLKEAEDAIELLEATVQWIKGLIALDKAGIIHRDISIGNLLLPKLEDKHKKDKQASIIDLGLAHLKWEPPSGSKTRDHASTHRNKSSRWSSEPHCRVTGTLPFVAWDLLAHASDPKARQHALHHDIESIFWVLLYIALDQSGETQEKSSPMSEMLDGLSSPDVSTVKNQKLACLEESKGLLHNIQGTFMNLRIFLWAFAEHYKKQRRQGKTIDPETVLNMAKVHLTVARRAVEEALSTSQQPDRSTHQQTDPKPQAETVPQLEEAHPRAAKRGAATPSTSQQPDRSTRQRTDPPRTNKPLATKRKQGDNVSLQTIDEDPRGDAHRARSAKISKILVP